MRIKIIKFVVKALGYEWSGDELKLPIWYVKEKKKKQWLYTNIIAASALTTLLKKGQLHLKIQGRSVRLAIPT